MSFNKITIIGNLGRDPELRYTPQGTPVCDFSLATNAKRKNSAGEISEEVTWFKITFWNRQAEIASQYLTKGRQVYIEGRLSTRQWTDKDGHSRTSLEVFGTALQLLTPADDAHSNSKAIAVGGVTFNNNDTPDITEDDIPF